MPRKIPYQHQNSCEQKQEYRDAVDAVHHFEVYICSLILFAEYIQVGEYFTHKRHSINELRVKVGRIFFFPAYRRQVQNSGSKLETSGGKGKFHFLPICPHEQ